MDTSSTAEAEFKTIAYGKKIGDHIYFHGSLSSVLPALFQETIATAATLARVKLEEHFNVIKLHRSGEELSLLHYPEFFDDAFPALTRSWRVNLARKSAVYRSYEESRNPPILHRKELLLPSDDPRIPEYAALTATAESIGLFTDSNRIGFREHWLQSIAERGYQFADGQFIPLANSADAVQDSPIDQGAEIRRHLTALARSNFSAPVQALLRQGLITSETSFFDYGCGRGDDVRGLVANGIHASGWDPHYAPDAEKRAAEAVNIGFVINVIENLDERIEALKGAYACTNGVLSIAAMLTSAAPTEGRQYQDGYLSSRNTFQKYFTQSQLRDFIEHTLDESAIASGPGVFFVFRDKDLEQRFLSKRYGHRSPTILSRGWAQERPHRERIPRIDRATRLFEENRDLFAGLWLQCLDLGRRPDKEEAKDLEHIVGVAGSLPRALRLVEERFDTRELTIARNARSADIQLLLAMQQFEKRKPYRHLESGLQRDIRYFFGDYTNAQDVAKKVLYSLADASTIDAACREAAEKGLGWLEESQSFQLHVSLIERLPAVLRIFVGCATVMFGDVSTYDLVKIHVRSGKVSLMKYDDFENSALPRLIQRVKVKLRDLDVDIFDYGESHAPTLLYYKSRFINEEHPRYSEQVQFEEALDQLGLFDLSGYGPPEVTFRQRLESARWEISGFNLVRSTRIPNVDEKCGQFRTYRDLIECGETHAKTGLPNLPTQADSYTALYELCVNLLDPVIDYFGSIKLTYGFCSPELRKHIQGRIAPELDQHAAHEKNRVGNLICPRLGAAVDFLVEDEDMLEVSEWVRVNTPFDRMYCYGPDRPIHVSYGPQHNREVIDMVQHGEKLIPKRRRSNSS
jgi:DNA phosphorothioation-associated putative methyltransferase